MSVSPRSSHTFRRTYISMLAKYESSVKLVQELARHANVSMTLNVYALAMGDDKRRANARVVELIKLPVCGEKETASA
jgi:integrase